MNDRKITLTVGQMAALHGINKRTLHYYDQIHLFSPSVKGDNGYRYYTLEQIGDLEMILALRELGMSLRETEEAMDSDAGCVHRILADKIEDIDKRIESLKGMKRLLEARRQLAQLAAAAKPGMVERIVLSEERFQLSRPITGDGDEGYYEAMTDLIRHEGHYRLFNHDYGLMICCDKVLNGDCENYDRAYIKPLSAQAQAPFIRPGGRYLRIVHKGHWQGIPQAYACLAAYARAHYLSLKGYAYERGLNETLSSNLDKYVTEIVIAYEG